MIRTGFSLVSHRGQNTPFWASCELLSRVSQPPLHVALTSPILADDVMRGQMRVKIGSKKGQNHLKIGVLTTFIGYENTLKMTQNGALDMTRFQAISRPPQNGQNALYGLKTPSKLTPKSGGTILYTHTRARSIDWCQFPVFRPFLRRVLKGVYL